MTLLHEATPEQLCQLMAQLGMHIKHRGALLKSVRELNEDGWTNAQIPDAAAVPNDLWRVDEDDLDSEMMMASARCARMLWPRWIPAVSL